MTTTADLLFAPRTMLQAVLKMDTPSLFLKQTFFPIFEQVETLNIELDEIIGDKTMAGYSHPQGQTAMVQKQGFKNKIWTPAFVNQGVEINAYEVASQRVPGQTVYEATNIINNATKMLGTELIKLSNMITRREEHACSEILKTGKLHIYGGGEDRVIDFEMPNSHKITLTGDDLFTSANSDPAKILDDICTLVGRNPENYLGAPNIAVLGRNVASAFLSHAKVIGQESRFNNLGINMGQIAPNKKEDKVRYIGDVRIINSIQIFYYAETYQDDKTKVVYDIMDPNYIYLGKSESLNRFFNAGIADLDAGTNNVSDPNYIRDIVNVNQVKTTNIVATPRYPKTWRQHNPSAQMLALQSSFLPLLLYPASFASVKAT